MNNCKDITELKVLFSEKEIQNKILEMAQILNEKYKNKQEVHCICVLSGAIMFFTDLVKRLNFPHHFHFIKISSYMNEKSSTGNIKEILFDLKDATNKDILIIEDIVDSGYSAKYITDKIKKEYNPKSLFFTSLLDKKTNRKIEIKPDLYGFDIDDKFLVGYGLDYEGLYRNLPYIGYFE